MFFLELSCFFHDPVDVGNLISGSSTFSKTIHFLNIWKFTVHVLLKPGLENFEHYFTSINTKIRLIIFFAAKDGEALYSQQKQDWEMTVAQIMNSLLLNSDLN